MSPEQILTIVSLLLSPDTTAAGFPVIAAGGGDARYPVKVEACPRPLPATEVEGRTVVCGRVSVPENHDRPDGPKIQLAFSVLKARTLSPAPDPVIYLHGGPGGGAVSDLAAYVAAVWDGYRNTRDVVTFDQRAAGISSDMVTCFGTLGTRIPEILNPANANDAAQVKLLSDCADELKKSGRDLPSYNTVQNARDVRALMSALGYPVYNIYGVSYGTKLGLEVMRSAPEGVRSVILDSVFPPNERGYDNNLLPVQEGVQVVVDQCNADPACAKAYPRLDETINRVAEKLRLNPIPAAGARPAITVKTMIGLFEDRNSGSPPQVTAHIPLILTEWDRGETKTWDMLSSGATARRPTTADILTPHLDRLTPEQQALASLLLDQASAGVTDAAAAARAVQALSDSLAKSSLGRTGLAARFDKIISDAIISTHSVEEIRRFLTDYAALATQKPDRAVLRSLVVDHLPDTQIDPALALLDQLTDADVEGVFEAVSKEARTIYKPLVGVFDLIVVACQEDMPFNSIDGMKKVIEGVKYPFLKQSSYADATTLELCDYVSPSLPMPGFHDAVTSDIPTLMLYGWNDTQTSAAAAQLAVSTLKNGRILGFPEAGHGALLFSQCAKDIGLAFIDRPEAPLTTGCIDKLKPKWVLPPP